MSSEYKCAPWLKATTVRFIMHSLHSCALAAIYFVVTTGLASAGEVRGLVRDGSGAAIAGAVVALLTPPQTVPS